ncbi:LacI family DNA-binding transcriptional regulator [Nonomuraea rosea]|uniref:LacI family DNA-binding transcriptional regulator n=2 Tax=Nonomuraea rosea TaxID=638574 RepID=A0ABP6YZ33_9ACTN
MRLADIAVQAGVSEATVSRVLNGRPGVAADTRQAVLTALDVLGYERPVKLRQNHTGLIGLILPELNNPIFPAFAQVIENALVLSGYTAVLCTQTPGGITEDDYTALLLERGVAGIIFVNGLHADSRSDRARYLRLIELGLPMVLINGYRADIEGHYISNDDVAALDMAVNHLVSLGHRRIGLAVGQERFVPTIRKTEGFKRAVADYAGVTDASDLVVNTLYTVEGGRSAAQQLLERGCTAICCGSDIMAIGAIKGARSMGLRVPEDVSVVGFDDTPMTAYLDPPLTTLRQPVREMGLAAVAGLLDEIRGLPAPRGELVHRPELVVRRSSAPARAALHAATS